jgi:hypothetical protein
MVIDQRNAGASVSLTDGLYFLDRWKGSISQISKVSAQLSTTSTTGFTNSLGLTVSTAFTVGAGDYAGVLQPVEGYNVADLGFGTANAKTITVSFKVRSSIAGTYCVAIHNSATNRSYVAEYTINSADTFETKTITFTGDTSGTWLTNNGVGLVLYFTVGMGATLGGATAGTWNASLKLATNNQTQWVQTSGATFYVTGVQLEVGTQATSFEYRQYQQELALCQRYCQVYGSGVAYERLGGGLGVATTAVNFTFPLNVNMRALPSISATGSYAWYNGTSVGAGTTFSIDAASTSVLAILLATTGIAAGGAYQVLNNNSPTSRFTVSAEL